jgi:hypothetical protein
LIFLIPCHNNLETTIYNLQNLIGSWRVGNLPLDLDQEESYSKGGDLLFFLLLLLLLFLPPLLLPPVSKSEILFVVGKDELGHGRE